MAKRRKRLKLSWELQFLIIVGIAAVVCYFGLQWEAAKLKELHPGYFR